MPITEDAGTGVKLIPTKGASAGEEAKKKKQLIMLAVLVPFLLFLIYNNVLKKPSAPSVPSPPVQAPQTTDVAPIASAITARPVVSTPIRQEQLGTSGGSFKGAEDEWGRSPFSLKSQAEEETGLITLRLDGIVYSSAGSYAVINQEIVRENDRIADNVVKEIRQDEVVLRSDEGELLVLKV